MSPAFVLNIEAYVSTNVFLIEEEMKLFKTPTLALLLMLSFKASATESTTDSLMVETGDSISATTCMTAINEYAVSEDSTALVRLNAMSDSLTSVSSDFIDEEAARLQKKMVPSIYTKPYSLNLNIPQWKRMWVNTAVLAGTFVSTLFVLECLPEDATSWNRASLQKTPPLKRWYRNVFVRGPEWDHDKIIFNYVLHPYAGAVYFMSTRTCGFNYWRSLLYCACISTIGWEYGIEAFMERPSIQDLLITPIIGSFIGEGFYHAKRHIVRNDYTLLGSRILGNAAVFLIDPVNEVIDLFRGSPERKLHLGRKNPVADSELADLPPRRGSSVDVRSSFIPGIPGCTHGFSVKVVF